VVSLEGEYDASVTFVVLGGAMIDVATLALAMWLFVHNTCKAERGEANLRASLEANQLQICFQKRPSCLQI
jgi:hypothetical protein